jgi:F420-dependent oxidoreductase-like protein
MANRALAAAAAMGRAGFSLGIGPSHQQVIERTYGVSFDHPGRHTEEYLSVLTALLRGDKVDIHGDDFDVQAGPLANAGAAEVPVLLAALGPRLLRVAGQLGAGTILWMANARAIESHVAPRIRGAAAEAGRPAPRIVAGLPIAVHDDLGEARAAVATQFAIYGTLPNYQRILARGGADSPVDATAIGDEAAVTATIRALFEAGATDVWAAPFPVGDDRRASRDRTRALLRELASAADPS